MILAAVLIALPAMAADEKHQIVRGVRATLAEGGETLSVELLLANGDRVKGVYRRPEEIRNVLALLELANREKVALYADLKGKALSALTIEFGSPIPYDAKREN